MTVAEEKKTVLLLEKFKKERCTYNSNECEKCSYSSYDVECEIDDIIAKIKGDVK